MYAIIATGGKQYKVSEGDIIGYHKKNGHRQLYTRVKIDKING